MPEGRTAATERNGRFLVVMLGPDAYALDAGRVRGLLRAPILTRMPGAPGALLGLANLRGRALPVVDLRRLVGSEAAPAAEPGRVVVTEVGEPVGLLVDRVGAFVEGDVTRDEATGEPRLALPGAGSAAILELPALIGRAFAHRTRPPARPAPPVEQPVAPAAEARPLTLVTFTAGGRRYGLSPDEVAEVMALPDDVVPVPQAGAAAIGLASRRGRLLPLLSLASLLGQARGAVPEGARVVVLRTGAGEVGLVVDRLGPILRLPRDAVEPVPAALKAGTASIVQAIGRVGADGLVSILATEHLLRAAGLERAPATAASHDAARAGERDGEAAPFILLDLAGETYGLGVSAIREVLCVPEAMTPLPRASALIAGIVNLRGGALPVIDQRQLFGLPAGEADPRRRIVVLDSGGAKGRHPVAGLLVDGASRLLHLPARSIRPAPDLTGPLSAALDRVATLADDRLLPLIDAAALLDGVRAGLAAAKAGRSRGRRTSAGEPAA